MLPRLFRGILTGRCFEDEGQDGGGGGEYLSGVHGMELVSVEVHVEAQVFARLQDGARGVQVEHPPLAEDVDVVHAEGAGGHQLLQPWQLDLQDVVCGLRDRLPSEETGAFTAAREDTQAAPRRSLLGHGVSPAVGGGDADGQGAAGLLDHLQHLQLGVQLEAVAALTLHQGRSCSQHPGQPAAEGGQQLRGRGGPSVLHREVNPSSSPVHIHVGGACQLGEKQTL